jgi:hypothetical protein
LLAWLFAGDEGKKKLAEFSASTEDDFFLTQSVAFSEQDFLEGLNIMLDMAQAKCAEPRLEAAKALCRIVFAAETSSYLPMCVEGLVHGLNHLLGDNWEGTRQYAVMACFALKDIDVYQDAFSQMPHLSMLVEMLACDSYNWTTARRCAAETLSALVLRHQNNVLKALTDKGIDSPEELEFFLMDKVSDDEARAHGLRLLQCF